MKTTSFFSLLLALVGALDGTTAFQVAIATGRTGSTHHQNHQPWMATPTSTIIESRKDVTPLAAGRDSPSSNDSKDTKKSIATRVGSIFLAASLAIGATTTGVLPLTPSPLPANAAEASKVIGELKGSGLVFKDTLVIERFADPKVKGVALYVSNFQRPLTEKLSKNFFSDPSSASVSCAKTGPVTIADNINKSKQGEEVFEESRSLLFKTLRVQRIYDEEMKTVVYVSFNTRLDKSDDANSSRFKSSLCAVNLEEVKQE